LGKNIRAILKKNMESASKMIDWKHRHVTYQIEANDETNAIKVNLDQI